MSLSDFAGGVVRERDLAAKRDVAKGTLALGQDRLGLAQNQFGAQQESEATQQLIKASQDLSKSIKSIVESGQEVPPSLQKSAEQFVNAAQDPQTKLMITGLFAEAVGAPTPQQAAVTEAKADVAGAEAITQQPLDTSQRETLAGVGGNKDDLLIRLQDDSAQEADPRRKAQIEALILKMTTQGKGVTVVTGDRKGGTALSKVRQEYLTGVATRGIAADELINTADLIDQSLDQVQGTGLDTGSFAEFRKGLASVAILGGFGDDFVEDVAALQNIDAASQKLRIMETEALKGAINQREFEAAEAINTALGETNLGNRFATKRMRAMGTMNRWMLERAEQFETGNPDATDNDIAKQLRKEFKNIPYFSKTLKDQRGLPLFFTEFREVYLADNANDSTRDIVEAWKAVQ